MEEIYLKQKKIFELFIKELAVINNIGIPYNKYKPNHAKKLLLKIEDWNSNLQEKNTPIKLSTLRDYFYMYREDMNRKFRYSEKYVDVLTKFIDFKNKKKSKYRSYYRFCDKVKIQLGFENIETKDLIYYFNKQSSKNSEKNYLNKLSHKRIQGEFKYISQANIESLVAEKLTSTFLELDIMALKSHLENQPWIDRAVVARQWPDTLLIKVIEQQPIARWNNRGFLNLRGEIVNLSNKTELNHLPLLRANDRYTQRVMQQYVLIVKLLSEYKFAPLVLELDNTLSWSLMISPAIMLRLGRDDTIEKLQRLMRVLQSDLKSQINKIAAIDMRYEQGFAVSWNKDLTLDFDTIGVINK